MKIYFCEKCGISIPLKEVVAGKATARDGKTYCGGCKPHEIAAAEDDLKLYFCDNCGVSIPLQDVIHNRAKTVGENMMCTDCSLLSEGQRAARRDRVEQERKEREESRYRLHFCDRCNTSIPQSHLVTGRAVMRAGRTYCERCRTKTERKRIGAGTATALILLLGVVAVAGFFIFGGGANLLAGEGEKDARARETALRKQIMDEVDVVLRERESRVRDAKDKIADLEGTVRALQSRNDQLLKDLGNLNEVADGILSEYAVLKSEMGKRLEGALGDFLKFKEDLSALSARIAELERRPAAPVEPAPARQDPPRAEPAVPDVPEPAPQPKVVEAPAEVKEWITQLSDKDAGVRFSAAVELGKSGWLPAAEPLARALAKDKDTFVRRAAARSLGELNAWSAVPVLIDTLDDRESFVATTAAEALKGITGQNFGYREGMSRGEVRRTVQKARTWWGQHKDDR